VDFINHFSSGTPPSSHRAPGVPRAPAARLKSDMSRRGSTCVYVNDNFRRLEPGISALVAKCRGQGGASGEIAALLQPQPRDYSVLKPRHSGFLRHAARVPAAGNQSVERGHRGHRGGHVRMATAQTRTFGKYKIRVPATVWPDSAARRSRCFDDDEAHAGRGHDGVRGACTHLGKS